MKTRFLVIDVQAPFTKRRCFNDKNTADIHSRAGTVWQRRFAQATGAEQALAHARAA